MNTKDIFKIIYWNVMPVVIGFILYFYIDKMKIPIIEKIIIFLVIIIPIIIIRLWLGEKIFKERPTLVEKIMSCSLRRKYGKNYCVECPDSYECASDIDGNTK